MVKKLLSWFFVCGLLSSLNAQLPLKYDLGGIWEFRQAGTTSWHPATVPGCVQLDLLNNKLIGDPFYRSDEDSVQWIDGNDWEYRRVFNLDASMFASPHIDLVFEGLDTYADVYLNDSLIVVADNMFREWIYENAKFRLKTGKNELLIRFPSITKRNRALYDKLSQKLPGDEKVVCRKAAYNFGWDWGPRLVTCGISKPVYLKLYDRVNLLGVQFIQKKITGSAATMSAVFTLTSDLPGTGRIMINNDSVQLMAHTCSIDKGKNVIRFDFVIRNPKLWWPSGLGTPYLYPLNYCIYLRDELVAKGKQKTGLRTIELVQQKDSIGSSFYFRVNNVTVFIKGANYIPQDNFPSRVSDSDYRALLTDVKGRNMNMLRVWGGGIYEKDIFYDICDELGIMVWQDFMFACAMYPGNREFLDNVNAESSENIIRLRRHPCLALWCGNNEIDEGWKNWGWIRQYNYSPADSAEVYDTYQRIFNVMLQDNVRRLDTLRPYVPTSPMFGWGNKSSTLSGDTHYWGVWWGKEPFTKYKEVIGRFASEYGFQAFPDPGSFKKFAKPEDLTLGSAVMKVHQKHPTGSELIDEYMLREFKRPKDFESYAYVSQVLQAEGIKTAIEAHRRAMPYCMGTMFWQYNDCWPVVSWSARDYYGAPKALHYYLYREYDDMLVSPLMEHHRLKVYVVSDRHVASEGRLDIEIRGFDGKVLRDTVYKFKVPSFSSNCVFDIDSAAFLKNMDPRKIVLTAAYSSADEDRKKYGCSFYFVPIKDLALEKPGIIKEISEMPGGYQIRLKTDKLARSVWLSAKADGKFSDNFVDIIPGKPVEIFFSTSYKQKDLPDKLSIRSLYDTY